MRKYRVIQLGTGNTGIHTLRTILQHPDLELVGLWDYDEALVGKDAGEIAGLAPCGVKATTDTQALIDMEADCISYQKADAGSNPSKPGSWADRMLKEMCAFLESGKNVVSTANWTLVYPYIWGPELVGRIEIACRKGNATFHVTGTEPGFFGDELLLSLTSLSQKIHSVRCQEILCYAQYNEPKTIRGLGFGAPMPDKAFTDKQGKYLGAIWITSVHMIADALGVGLDEVRGSWEAWPTEEDIEIAVGKIPAGTIGAIRFEVAGMIGGEPRIAVEHVTRIRLDVAPHWAQLEAGGFRVIIEGSPTMRVDIPLTEAGGGGDACVQACVATAARVVNSIPVVCDADPGIKTFLNLPRRVMGVNRMQIS